MFPKSFILLAALGQALEIRKGADLFKGEMSIQADEVPEVFGNLTSVTVFEGNGCPAGSYKVQPFEAGKSPNTTIEFDPSVFVYNQTIAPGPVSCGISFEFDFFMPEAEGTEINFGTRMELNTRYDQNDTARESGFQADYEITVRVQDETRDGGVLTYVSWNEGAQRFQVGAGDYPQGTPGEVATGSFSSMITLSTWDGTGEFSVSSIAVGFGVYIQSEWPQ